MINKLTINPRKIKLKSESIIRDAGGVICDHLPLLDKTNIRSQDEVIDRALVLVAMLQLHFEAPTKFIRDWIGENNLSSALSSEESKLIAKHEDDFSEQEKINLYWYIEALQAVLWATKIMPSLPVDESIPETQASHCPDFHSNEDGSKFRNHMVLRSYSEIFEKLDLYYRTHWWLRNGKGTHEEQIDWVTERRKVLEWIMDRNLDWDDIPLDT